MVLFKRAMIWLCALCVMGVFASAPVTVSAKRKEPRKIITITYKIRKGDTLQKVAKKHNVSVKQLTRWNKGLDPRQLQIGQRLRIAVVNPDWKDWKYGRKRKVAKSSRGGSKSLPPAKLDDKTAKKEIEELGLALPTKELPVAPKIEPVKVSASASKEVEELPDAMAFDGEDLPVVATRDQLLGFEPESKVLYVPQAGENIGSIALKFRLDPEDLMFWNDLEGLEPEAGSPILLQSDREKPAKREMLPVTHRIRRGDSFLKIAKRYGVSVKQLKRWNRKVNPRRLSIGKTLTLYVPSKDGVSRSYGSANRGRLHNGVPLESTTGLRVRTIENAYGTERVVRLIKGIAFDVKARWPNAPDMVIGDLSYKHGGRIKRHKSHQSGRDADITFYHRGNVELPDFRGMDYETFDAPRNWYVFKTLIDMGEVEYIFIDYPLQRILYEYALSIGHTEEELASILQYPEPRSANKGIIRHVRGHNDHWHVRFKCGPLDTSCH